MVKEYKQRRDVVIKSLDTIPGVEYYKPQGALYLIVKLPIDNAEYFCRWLLEEFNDQNETVMFAPAAGFYETEGAGKNEIRIAFVLDVKQLTRAMEILKIALEEYK
jgi:aspartate aminotransferase